MSSPTPAIEPTCGVCGGIKADHEKLNHEFNTEGQLIPKKDKPQPLRRPAVPGDTVILRLIDTLASKGLLNRDDLAHIFPPAVDPSANPH